MKKTLSLATAGLLMASMMVPAFATSTDPKPITDVTEDTSVEYSSEVKTGTIKITMNTSDKVYINPYGIAVKIGEKPNASDNTKMDPVNSTNQVISSTQFITNESDTGLKIATTVTAKPAKSIQGLAADETALKAATDKQALVQFQLMNVADASDLLETNEKWTDPAKGKGILETVTATTAGAKSQKSVYVAKKGDDGTPTYAAFRLTGQLVTEPQKEAADKSKVSDPWTADDTIDVVVAFTFTQSNTDPNA